MSSVHTETRYRDNGDRGGDLAVSATGLRKSFGGTEALRGVDLAVAPGTICGLLGPNGAGKTTAVRILATLLPADDGKAGVAGHDVTTEARQVRQRIGLAGQYAAVDELLSGRGNLEMVGKLYHLGAREARRRAGELLEQFSLGDAAGRLVKTYSGGMRRRLDLAASLVATPPVLFLDEPTTGLDPHSRGEMWDAIRKLVADGTTVLLTTQYLEEADQLADHVVVIDSGQVAASGPPAELKTRVGGERLEVVVRDTHEVDRAAAVLGPATGATPRTDLAAREVAVPAERGADTLVAAVRELDAAGVAIEDIALRRPTLDEVFLRLTGHAAADNATGEIDDSDAPAGLDVAR